MRERQAEQTPEHTPLPLPEDAKDCMQCLIDRYGDTHIDTLAQLLSLTSNAESDFARICIRRVCNYPVQSRPVQSRPVQSRPVQSRPVQSR
jgi:hypothetical protein